MNQNINRVFNVEKDGRTNLYPPSQIFANKNFKFLLSIGGSLVDNEQQYNNLAAALKGIGESCLHVVEHKRTNEEEPPFVGKLQTSSDYETLTEMEKTFDPTAAWVMANIFIFGDNPNWGIYVCEYPTILIIGCIEEYVPIFQQVYNIKGNGFAELDEFISWEYGSRPHLREKLIKNYQLFDNQ